MGYADWRTQLSSQLSLDLEGKSLSVTDSLRLAAALKSNATLVELRLSCNVIGPGNLSIFTAALKSNTSLTTLELNSNAFVSADCTALAQILLDNTGLTSISISYNNLGGNVETSSPQMSWDEKEKMRALSMSFVTAGGLHEVGAALRANRSLQVLKLERN